MARFSLTDPSTLPWRCASLSPAVLAKGPSWVTAKEAGVANLYGCQGHRGACSACSVLGPCLWLLVQEALGGTQEPAIEPASQERRCLLSRPSSLTLRVADSAAVQGFGETWATQPRPPGCYAAGTLLEVNHSFVA